MHRAVLLRLHEAQGTRRVQKRRAERRPGPVRDDEGAGHETSLRQWERDWRSRARCRREPHDPFAPILRQCPADTVRMTWSCNHPATSRDPRDDTSARHRHAPRNACVELQRRKRHRPAVWNGKDRDDKQKDLVHCGRGIHPSNSLCSQRELPPRSKWQ